VAIEFGILDHVEPGEDKTIEEAYEERHSAPGTFSRGRHAVGTRRCGPRTAMSPVVCGS
jgi:hypothetical protein